MDHTEPLWDKQRRQPTIDGKNPLPSSPTPPRGRGRPRLPIELQTKKHQEQREWHERKKQTDPGYGCAVMAKQARLKNTTSPVLPYKPLTSQQKMSNILDWHTSCPSSQAYPPEDDPDTSTDSWDEATEELLDLKRYPFSPPKGEEEAFFEE